MNQSAEQLKSRFRADLMPRLPVELEDLKSLPTMTKREMMGAFNEIVTDRRLTLERVQAHLAATTDVPGLLEGDHFAITTGGSSGLKGVFVYD